MCLTDIKIGHSDGFFTAEMFLLYFFKAIEPLMHHQCKHILVILYKNLQAAGFAPSAAAVLLYGVCVFCLCSARRRALSADDGCGITESERIKTKT